MFDLFKNKPFKCFVGEYGDQKIASRVSRGVKAIPIDKIVGTVGRCHDNNRWADLKDSHRYQSIKRAIRNLKSLPAIEVYKVDDEYYIVDGHHRVMASRDVGRDFIDAHVEEYVFSGQKKEADYTDCPMKNFEEKTGLKGIVLSSKERYNQLLTYIKDFGDSINQNLSLDKVAKFWYEQDFISFINNHDDNEENEETESEKYYQQKVCDNEHEDTSNSR